MGIIGRTLILLPGAILCGLGLGIFYLLAIMICVTGGLPDVSTALNGLSGFDQIVEALKP